MAELGTVYNYPEDGYVRYDFNNALFSFTDMPNIRSWGLFGKSSTSSFTFYIKNCNEIRFINLTESSCGTSKVYLNDVESEYTYYSNFSGTGKTNGYYTLCCILPLTEKYNKITITNNGTNQMNFQSIDVLEGAELITEDEYIDKTTINLLIKQGAKYYNIQDGALVEVSDYITELNSIDGNVIKNISDIIPFVNDGLLEDGWKLVSNKDLNIGINGLKTRKEFVVSKHVRSLKMADYIHNIVVNPSNNDGITKCVISFDNGITWNTCVNGTWEQLENTYSSTDSNELFFAEIESKGITGDDLSTIDFNDYKDGNIQFAFMLSDYVHLKGVDITYNLANSYEILGSNDIKIQKVLGKCIKIIPKRDIDKAIIEILTTGIIES